jgi:hypothetical protein
MNGTPECSFVAGHKAGWRFQTYTIAVAASGASRKVKATVRLARIRRPAEIEIRGVNGNLDGDRTALGADRTR